jgi:ribosomal protein S18 acetylase RimI-like enzyme
MPALGIISPVRIELLDRNRHDRAGFDCGVPALNAYLQRQAAQDEEKRAAVVYVTVLEPPAIAGYYTLSLFSIGLTHLPETEAKKLARYPLVSATLLGRLAVSEVLKGRRFGEELLFDALRRSLAQSRHIASAGVVVDAKDEKAVAFYQKYDFTQILDADHRLFLSMNKIQHMFGEMYCSDHP